MKCGVVLRQTLITSRRGWVRRQQLVVDLLRKKPGGAAEIVEQVRVIRMAGQGRFKIIDSICQIAVFQLSNPQPFPGVGRLKLRNSFSSVALRQKSIAKRFVEPGELAFQFNCLLERLDGIPVAMGLHIGGAEIEEGGSRAGVQPRRFLEFADGDVQLSLLLGRDPSLLVFHNRWTGRLHGEEKNDRKHSHCFVGSVTSIKRSTLTSLSTCRVPDGQSISSDAVVPLPSPK